jgi:uncharacterized membrane protein YhaH (DUF805 family)
MEVYSHFAKRLHDAMHNSVPKMYVEFIIIIIIIIIIILHEFNCLPTATQAVKFIIIKQVT